MLPTKRAELILERHLAMMLFLRRDIRADLLDIRLAYGERAVSTLPVEVAERRPLFLHPLRGTLLCLLHKPGDGDGAGKVAEDVDVIFHAADEDGLAPDVLQDARHVGMQPRTQFRVFEKGHAVLRAEDDMQDNAGKRLRHNGGNCYAPSGLCPFFVSRPRAALVPRLPWAGLRQAFGLV